MINFIKLPTIRNLSYSTINLSYIIKNEDQVNSHIKFGAVRKQSIHFTKGIKQTNSLNVRKNIVNSYYRNYCTPKIDPIGNALLDLVTFEMVCSDTLESLCDYFEEIVENANHLKSADVSFGDGVLNINFGKEYGTYVINRQAPNRQIWLSSPKSGPKRFDFIKIENKTQKPVGYWFYKHDGSTLHEILQHEIKDVAKMDVDFINLPFGNRR